jgi:hypothetical protein
MMLELINKILFILFFLSCVNVIRHAYYFIQAYSKAETENVERYKLDKTPLILLGISIAVIFTSIFSGITI